MVCSFVNNSEAMFDKDEDEMESACGQFPVFEMQAWSGNLEDDSECAIGCFSDESFSNRVCCWHDIDGFQEEKCYLLITGVLDIPETFGDSDTLIIVLYW